MRDNGKNQGGSCIGIIIWIIILVCAFNSCNDDSDKEISDKVDEVVIETKQKINKNEVVQEEYMVKFQESGKLFYDTYMEYFGPDFSIEDEPFENGVYKGEHREKYNELRDILDDMCFYYKNIEDSDVRYDALASLEWNMYEYIYNVRQMIVLIDRISVTEYDSELFIIEFSDYIIY